MKCLCTRQLKQSQKIHSSNNHIDNNLPKTLLKLTMTKACDLSGKKVQFGNNVSKANNKTRRKFNVNLQSVTFKSDILNKNIRFSVATSSIRTVSKFGGIDEFLMQTKSKKLSQKAKRVQRAMNNSQKKAS